MVAVEPFCIFAYSETTSAEDVVTALIPLGATLEDESEIDALEKWVDIASVNEGICYLGKSNWIKDRNNGMLEAVLRKVIWLSRCKAIGLSQMAFCYGSVKVNSIRSGA